MSRLAWLPPTHKTQRNPPTAYHGLSPIGGTTVGRTVELHNTRLWCVRARSRVRRDSRDTTARHRTPPPLPLQQRSYKIYQLITGYYHSIMADCYCYYYYFCLRNSKLVALKTSKSVYSIREISFLCLTTCNDLSPTKVEMDVEKKMSTANIALMFVVFTFFGELTRLLLSFVI